MYTKELHPPTNDYSCWPDYLQRQPGGGSNPLDADGDGIVNVGCDNCAGANPGFQWVNPWQEDYDGDGVGDACDPCPLSASGAPCPAIPEPPLPQASIVDLWSSTIPVVTLAELHIYGSDRIGMYLPNAPRDTAQLVNVESFVRSLRKREYEMKDHLGNVRVTISDLKIGSGTPAYSADIRSYTNHSAFGMVQPDRSWVVSGGYRYGFNGKESDNEISGNGNQYDYGFRIYNPRIARFLSEDPLTKGYPMLTPYQFAGNTPIWAIDLDGLEPATTTETTSASSNEPKLDITHTIQTFNLSASAAQLSGNIKIKWIPVDGYQVIQIVQTPDQGLAFGRGEGLIYSRQENNNEVQYTGFVDGGPNSPYAGLFQNGKPISETHPWFINTENGNFQRSTVLVNKDNYEYNIRFFDRTTNLNATGGITYFETYVVALNYNNSATDKIIGAFTWQVAADGKVSPQNIKMENNASLTEMAQKIIKNDYPNYIYNSSTNSFVYKPNNVQQDNSNDSSSESDGANESTTGGN